MEYVMKRTKDDLLREAIEQAGYYISKDIAVTLDDNCDLSYAEQIALLLAREVARSRPDLLDAEPNKDLVYVVNNGGGDNYSLPSSDLTALLENEKPYDDAVIGVYSLSERKLVHKLYKGNGTKWVPYYGAKK